MPLLIAISIIYELAVSFIVTLSLARFEKLVALIFCGIEQEATE
jgi:hypothetical protein